MNKAKVPQIRFLGFDGEWSSHSLAELGKIITGSTPSTQNSNYYSENGMIWVTPTDISQNIIFDSAKKLSIQGQNVARIVPKNTILVTCIASIGKNTLLGVSGSFNQQINALVPNCEEYTPYFLFTQSALWSRQMKRKAGALTFQIINKTEFEAIETLTPKKGEQEKIGDFFGELDNLIALNQAKYDKLVKIKSAMLEKMFPKAGSRTPELRFAGFTEDWVDGDIEKTFDLSVPNNTLSRAELCEDEGEINNIHYGDVLIKFGAFVDISSDKIPFIINGTVADFKAQLLKNGDIILADTAEDSSVGKVTEITNIQSKVVVSGLHTIILRPLIKFQSYYLGYYMNSYSYHHQLLRLMQGSKVSSVNKTSLKKTTIQYPTSSTEQSNIGIIFKTIDKLLAVYLRKLAKLKNIKSALLEKMFV